MTELEKLLYELDPTGTSKTFHVTKDTLERLANVSWANGYREGVEDGTPEYDCCEDCG